MRQQRLPIKRSGPATPNRLLSALRTYFPGAWIDPKQGELISLYRLRYRMAMEEQKHETAMIFLNKILELDPMNLEAKLCKGEPYHRCLKDYPKAIEQYNKILRMGREAGPIHERAREAMAEIMELLS